MTNPFRQPESLWKVSFPFKYENLELFEEYFATLTDSVSSHELSSKTVESMPDDLWSFEAYFEISPDIEELRIVLQKLAGDEWEHSQALKLEKVEDLDWVAQMHEDFKPIAVGRFFITNPTHQDECPGDMEKIIIESSRAFGTGEHSTTKGCLEAMEALGDFRPKTIYDIGTGTGILAIAAAKIWPGAQIVGTDIEPVAIEVSKLHASNNGANIGFIVSDNLPAGGKVDLIISNILKAPLITFAPDFAARLSDDGIIILSGFLDYQLADVEEAYLKAGLKVKSILNREGWISLTLTPCSSHT